MSPARTIDGLAGLRAPARAGVRAGSRAGPQDVPPRLAGRRRIGLLVGFVLASIVTLLGVANVLVGMLGTIGALAGGAAYLLLAATAVAEIRASQRDRVRLAAIEERRRVARELHDGVAQEVLHLLAQARRLRAQQPGLQTDHLLSAAQRTLDESRSAISALRAPPDESLPASLERVACELGRRLDLDVQMELDPAVDPPPPVCDAIVRIVGEALANAARHGEARSVLVALHAGAPGRVLVRDDGFGFDPDPALIPEGAYGLVSMRERAASVGGRLAIRSTPGAGTEVEMTLP